MSYLQNFIFDKSYWWLRHSVFWLIFYLDFFSYIVDYSPELKEDFIQDCISLILDFILVYTNLYFLIPKFALKNKIVKYLVWTILGLLLTISINLWLESILYTDYEAGSTLWSMYYTALITLGVLAPAIAIKIGKHFYWESVKSNELESTNLKSELNYLKKQINPHFLFNSLNNIHILAKEKSDKTADTILQLSDLMRYQTYEAAKEKVKLSKEIDFIDNYLKLEQIRRDNLDIQTNIKGDIKKVLIEPLIFLPFVENACKYSAKLDGGIEVIKIELEVDRKYLNFSITNEKGYSMTRQEHSGFGLENVTKRLNLLYPNSYKLNISENEREYSVNLNLDM